jgi:hypothetical protein
MRGGTRVVRPRRACCHRCETTHVLLPAFSVPRRRDGAEVIGYALLAKAQGEGHRTIAARLGRPPGTVRGWLRAFACRAEVVGSCARRWTYAVDAAHEGHSPPAGSPLADAVDALGTAARACRLSLETSASPWELAVALTGLLHGRPRDPPGFSPFAPRSCGSCPARPSCSPAEPGGCGSSAAETLRGQPTPLIGA